MTNKQIEKKVERDLDLFFDVSLNHRNVDFLTEKQRKIVLGLGVTEANDPYSLRWPNDEYYALDVLKVKAFIKRLLATQQQAFNKEKEEIIDQSFWSGWHAATVDVPINHENALTIEELKAKYLKETKGDE